MTEINSFRDEYAFLSNFYTAEVKLDGSDYPTVEHAFQAAKTDCDAERYAIRIAKTANEAKKLGQDVALRRNWEAVKVKVMYNLLKQKFAVGTDLAERLLATGDAKLIEGNWWNDKFWGVCRGKGKNQLGRLLMKIREELRNGS